MATCSKGIWCHHKWLQRDQFSTDKRHGRGSVVPCAFGVDLESYDMCCKFRRGISAAMDSTFQCPSRS